MAPPLAAPGVDGVRAADRPAPRGHEYGAPVRVQRVGEDHLVLGEGRRHAFPGPVGGQQVVVFRRRWLRHRLKGHRPLHEVEGERVQRVAGAGGREGVGATKQCVSNGRADGQSGGVSDVEEGSGVYVARGDDVAAQGCELHGTATLR